MRVLEITGEPILRGGQETFIMNCITHMDDKDIQFDILTPYYCENDYFKALLSERGGRIYEQRLPFAPGKSRRNLFHGVLSFLGANDYDVVHIHSGSVSALAYMAKAANKAGVPKIIVHSHSTGAQSIKHMGVQCAFSRMMKHNPTHYCACSVDAGRMKFPPSVVKSRLVVLKNGIDTARFTFNRSGRDELRNQLGITEDAPVIGHVGRFASEKNHAFIIEVFLKLLQRQNNARLVLIGDGELREQIEDTVRRHGIEDKVIFTGAVDEIWDYYNLMDVFILPSLYEGFPLAALEAQTSGLPCILSTGIPEEIELCNNVERIDIANENAWVSAILKNIGSRCPDNAESIRAKGYDIRDTVRHLYDIYR